MPYSKASAFHFERLLILPNHRLCQATLKRQQAIEKYARIKLAELTPNERSDQLETMTLEDWTDMPEWKGLSKSVQKELEQDDFQENLPSEAYNPALMMWLRSTLQNVSSEFLCEKLGVDSIEGDPIELESCPCCGFQTISQRGHYEICTVCWWEDDGQDNKHSDKIMGGPNHGVSLISARYNFLKFDLYDPKRTDLMKVKADKNQYKRGREFEIIDNEFLVEKGTDWKWKISFIKNTNNTP